MRKKNYVKPAIEMIEINVNSMLASSPGGSTSEGEGGDTGLGGGTAGDGPELSNRYRSNIWGTEW